MWAILQHAAWEDPGLIATAMAAHGVEFGLVRLDQGAALPTAAALDGLVVMGGPMGVYEAEQFPFLDGEIGLLRSCVARGMPVLGVCLGAQLLAAALGATVSKGPEMEDGGGWVRLTEQGLKDPVLGGGERTLPVVHWHQDTYTLPLGATLLASSDRYEQQAFRQGTRVYGLQFHIEVDESLAEGWRGRGLKLEREHIKQTIATGEGVFDRFLHAVRI